MGTKRKGLLPVLLAFVATLCIAALAACGGGKSAQVTLSLDDEALSLSAGGITTLTATVSGTEEDVLWSVEPALGVVTVIGSGEQNKVASVTAAAVTTTATAVITAKAGGKTAMCTVTVTPLTVATKVLESLTVSPSELTANELTVYEGDDIGDFITELTDLLTIIAGYSDGSDGGVALSACSLTGVLTAGTSTVTVSYTYGTATKNDTFTLEVQEIGITGISAVLSSQSGITVYAEQDINDCAGLDALIGNLTVKALYNNGGEAVLDYSDDYTLSGTPLASDAGGVFAVTVSYAPGGGFGPFTNTFDANVTAARTLSASKASAGALIAYNGEIGNTAYGNSVDVTVTATLFGEDADVTTVAGMTFVYSAGTAGIVGFEKNGLVFAFAATGVGIGTAGFDISYGGLTETVTFDVAAPEIDLTDVIAIDISLNKNSGLTAGDDDWQKIAPGGGDYKGGLGGLDYGIALTDMLGVKLVSIENESKTAGTDIPLGAGAGSMTAELDGWNDGGMNGLGPQVWLVTAKSADGIASFKISVTVVSKVITTITEFQKMYGTANAVTGTTGTSSIYAEAQAQSNGKPAWLGYFILGGNINGSGAHLTRIGNGDTTASWHWLNGNDAIVSGYNGFRGTFDGRGYALSNFVLYNTRLNDDFGTGFWGILGIGATVKNVAITDLTAEGHGSVINAYRVWVAFGVSGATLENLYLHTDSAEFGYSWFVGYLPSQSQPNTLKNVVAVTPLLADPLGASYGAAVNENVYYFADDIDPQYAYMLGVNYFNINTYAADADFLVIDFLDILGVYWELDPATDIPRFVNRVLSVPANLSESDGIITWARVEGNNGYEVQTGIGATPQPIAKNTESYERTDEPMVRVRALGDGAGILDSGWSEWLYFAAELDAPEGLGVSAGVLSWMPVDGNDGYEIEVGTIAGTGIVYATHPLEKDEDSYALGVNDVLARIRALGDNLLTIDSGWSGWANLAGFDSETPYWPFESSFAYGVMPQNGDFETYGNGGHAGTISLGMEQGVFYNVTVQLILVSGRLDSWAPVHLGTAGVTTFASNYYFNTLQPGEFILDTFVFECPSGAWSSPYSLLNQGIYVRYDEFTAGGVVGIRFAVTPL